MVDLAALKQHLAYSAWASGRLVEASARLRPDEFTWDFATADKGVLGTLVHVFAADRIWLARVQGQTPGPFIDPEKDMNMATLTDEWPKVHAGWQAFLDGVTDVATPITYKDLKGNSYTTPLWQIVLHVVNHGTHHRGQVSGFMRTMTHTPPPIDAIYYYRSLSS